MATALSGVAEEAAARARNNCKRDARSKKPRWPRLPQLRLTDREISRRRHCIGGSDANSILSGDASRVLRLWREKRGEAEPEDLGSILQVMLGSWTEAFNRQWYEMHTGQEISLVGTSHGCSEHEWRRCTLDGFVEAQDAVFEAKHVAAFFGPEEVLARYMPQLQHNMAVKGCELSLLSVIYGNHKWEVYEVEADWLYQDELLATEQAFWDCVHSGEPPAALPPPPPPRPNATRELCLEGNNLWAMSASDWLDTREAARRHVLAIASLKDLIAPDVARAFGHGIEAKRSKSGAITIKELAE
jgi:hypothetical protein